MRKFAVTVAAIVSMCGVACAGTITVFTGADIGASSTDPRPNSNAAAASFDAAASALGSEQIITFESSPVGAFSTLQLAPGVSLTGANIGLGDQTIRNSPLLAPDNLYGYNTTAGGTNFLSLLGGTATFTFSFSSGTQAFGAYFSGVNLPGETLSFNDGAPETVSIPLIDSNVGGVEFVGFIDTAPTSSVTISTVGDIIGVDDVRYVVPEPAWLGVCGLAGVALLIGRRAARSVS